MKIKEEINTTRLNQIIRTQSNLIEEEQFKLLLLLQNRKSNKYFTNYLREDYENESIGRLFARNTVCLQRLSRNVRNALGESIYVDVDMINSNYQILECLAEQHGIEHRLLKSYNASRELQLQKLGNQLGLDRDEMKELFCMIPCGGHIKTWMSKYNVKHLPDDVFALRDQIVNIRDFLLDLEKNAKYTLFAKHKKGKDNWNIKGCAFSYLLQDIEHDILLCFVERAKRKHKIRPGVLMHDGCMFYSQKYIPDNILRDLEDHVKSSLNYTIHLKCKPMEYDESILGEDALYEDIGPSASEVSRSSSTVSGTVIRVFMEFAKEHNLVRDKRGRVYYIHEEYPYHCEQLIMGEGGGVDKIFEELVAQFQQWCEKSGRHEVIGFFMDKPVEIMNNMKKYFAIFNHKDFPFVYLNRHMIGFKNGVWNIKTLEFIPKDSLEDDVYVRRFYEVDFEKDTNTPLWDNLLKFQLEDDYTVSIVEGLLGRLFFKVNEMDRLEILAALQGPAGNGKSTVIEAMKEMFLEDNVATIDKNTSSQFCLEGKDTCQCILIPDAKVDLSTKLDQQVLQSMVSGESVDVNCKNKQHYTVSKWSVPMLLAFNRNLGYEDDGGSLVRRLGCIPWMKLIPSHLKDTNLKEKINKSELPYVFIKLIKGYHNLLKLTEGGKSFWEVAPDCMLMKQNETSTQSNDVACFLSEGPDTNRYYVMYKEGALTNLEDFKSIFKMYVKIKYNKKTYQWSNVCDNATLEAHGYRVERCNLCKSCNNVAIKGCCHNYNASNRYKKYVIHNMDLVDVTSNDD